MNVFRVYIETPSGNRYQLQQIHIPEDYPAGKELSALAEGLRKLADEFDVREFRKALSAIPETEENP